MPESNNPENPSDTMEGRIPKSQLSVRLLIQTDRWLLAGGILIGLLLVFLALGMLDPAPISEAIENKDPIETLFQALVTAIITGVTLVVTINQLVLSQELGAVGEQRDRMEQAMTFRRDVESRIDRPITPPEPASFLQSIILETQKRADALADEIDAEGEFDDHLQDFVSRLKENAQLVSDHLDDAQFGTFEVVFAALDYNYSWKIYEARRLQQEYADSLSEQENQSFSELIESLELFGPAREHFKTLYFQWELINLSRAVMFAAVPALAVTTSMILFVDNPGSVTGTILGIDALLLLVSIATTIALLPFLILLSYILRIATVAKRTLAIGPFVLRETDRSDSIDWE